MIIILIIGIKKREKKWELNGLSIEYKCDAIFIMAIPNEWKLCGIFFHCPNIQYEKKYGH